MTGMVKAAAAFSIVALIFGLATNASPAAASLGFIPESSIDEAEKTIWQIGIFDDLKHEFGFDFLDDEFVCDSPPSGGPGDTGSFIVGFTPVHAMPHTIASSDAPESDDRFEHSCNSLTIEFDVPDGYAYDDVVLRYSRMGGEADEVIVDGESVGVAGGLMEDPHPSRNYLFNLDGIGPGEHTVQIVGMEITPCEGGPTCRDGLADGYHFIDGLRLSGDKRKLDDGDDINDVEIDIKPGNRMNVINPRSRGKITVAILSGYGMDASDADPDTVRFGPDEAPKAHNMVVLVDVNRDGVRDMVLHFNTQNTGIECGDDAARLFGETKDGDEFEGSDSVLTVGCKNDKGKDDKGKDDKDKGDKGKDDKGKDKKNNDDDDDNESDVGDDQDSDSNDDQDDDSDDGRSGDSDDGDDRGRGRDRDDHPGQGQGLDKDKLKEKLKDWLKDLGKGNR